MMQIERMRPEDFDAVFRLLSQSFPAGSGGMRRGSWRPFRCICARPNCTATV